MNLLDLIPPTGASLLYLCKVADLFPIECRERLDQLEAQGKVERITVPGSVRWRPVINATPVASVPAKPFIADIIARREQLQSTTRGCVTALPSTLDIINQVASRHGVEAVAVVGGRRYTWVVEARDESAYRLRQERRMSYPEIAQALGYKSHSAVIVAVKRHLKRRGEVASE